MEQSLFRHIQKARGTEAEYLAEQAALQEQDRLHMKQLTILINELESDPKNSSLVDYLSTLVSLYETHLRCSLEIMKLHNKPELEEFVALRRARRTAVDEMFLILNKIAREHPDYLETIDEIVSLQALENRTN